MKTMTKHRIKNFIKGKIAWFIGTGIVLLAALVILIVGFAITGFNFVEWLNSPYFTTLIILVSIGLFAIIMLLLYYKRFTLGEK